MARASIEDLSDFLSKMDSSIAVNTKASQSLIQGSNIEPDSNGANGHDSSLNNTHTRLSDSGEEEIAIRSVNYLFKIINH